jgi:hypothetical protein
MIANVDQTVKRLTRHPRLATGQAFWAGQIQAETWPNPGENRGGFAA